MSTPIYLTDKKRSISGTPSANVSSVVSFKLLFALMCMLFRTCIRLVKPLIFNASNQIKTPRLCMAGLCKATLCVLDAEIWIIRVLHVIFQGRDPLWTRGRFFGQLFLSLYQKRWQQLFISRTKKKRTDYLHSKSLLNVILRRLSYKVKYGCGQFNFSLEHSFQRCISKILARKRLDF